MVNQDRYKELCAHFAKLANDSVQTQEEELEKLAMDDAAIGRPGFAIVDGIGKGDFVGHVCLDYAVTYSANR